MTVYRYDTVQRLAARALAGGGAQKGPTMFEWDISGRCQTPVVREIVGRTDWFANKGDGAGRSISVIMTCKCRKCDRCMLERRWAWSDRIQVECRDAARTWFGTFTFSPGEQHKLLTLARSRWAKKSEDFDALDEKAQQVELLQQSGGLLTLFFKRLRKNTGSPLRYCLVSEFHLSGLPHWHCVIHETDRDKPISWRQLTGEWPHGFTTFKLIPSDQLVKTSRYVAKYLSKSAVSRVRASAKYGKTDAA